ncbi:MAG: class I SAM-dependent methyltransferase [Methylococcales bacterium]
MRLVEFAHEIISAVLRPGDIAIDATVGNGLDTLFLAHRVDCDGFVYGFDIQPEAIRIARCKLHQAGLENRARLVLGSHADLERHIANEHRPRVKAVMFNLGYLPGGNRTIRTTPKSACIALESACSLLSGGGRITVLCYTAHPGGRTETDQIKKFVTSLSGDFRFTVHSPENTLKAPPELIVIERCNARD